MRVFILFLCLCSEPLDRREQSVVVGQQFTDREGRRCKVYWVGDLAAWQPWREVVAVLVDRVDGHGSWLYLWSEFQRMLEEQR